MFRDTIVNLLLRKFSAEIVDFWNEYAITTKVWCFRFTPFFKAVINDYFQRNPHRAPVKSKPAKETVVATIKEEVYHLFYRNFKLKELKQKIAEGYDSLCSWLKEFLNGWVCRNGLMPSLFSRISCYGSVCSF